MSYSIVVNGACGRMGQMVATALRAAGFQNVAGRDRQGEPELQLSDGVLPLVTNWRDGLEPGGVVVDFSHPDATQELVEAATERSAKLVIGTTAQNEAQLQSLRQAAQDTAVLLAHNFSVGINQLTQVLPALRVLTRAGFDVECVEAHHRHKRDAPSGTAQMLLRALLDDATPVHGRSGRDLVRQSDEVGMHALRLGGIPGDHALLLASDDEVIEIRHRALTRRAFVSGVAPAVRFVKEAPPGLYTMLDVMGNVQKQTS